jgi:VanZ family protein
MNKFLRYWFPVLLYVTLIFTVSSIQNLKVPDVPGLTDKLVHGAEYGVLGFLLVRALRGTNLLATSLSAALISILIGLVVGLADELYQAYVPGRISDPGDYAVDALGLVVSAALFLVLRVAGRRRGRRARA